MNRYCIVMALFVPFFVVADPLDQARRIHDRLTGTPPTNEMLTRMAEAIEVGDNIAAAEFAMDGAPASGSDPFLPANGNFYRVLLKNWATPATNQSFDIFAPLNDYSATVIGMVRDSDSTEIDFRDLLSANIIYTAELPGIPPYSNYNNDHYLFLESSAADLSDPDILQRREQSTVTGIPATGTAGVQTTRAAARAFFIDGTNRAMFRFTLVNNLCMDLEQLKDTTRPADRIRQDVSRSPGLDSSLFLNQCAGCHSGMDPMAQAYAYYNYEYPSAADVPGMSQEEREEMGRLVYSPGQVQAKYHINAGNFVYGFETANDHWTNYWRLGENSERIGWLQEAANTGATDAALNPAYSEGDGASSLGNELSHTKAFASCQVEKVYYSVCGRTPGPADTEDVNSITDNFSSSGNMKRVFSEVAVACSGHL